MSLNQVRLRDLSPYLKAFVMSSPLTHAEDLGRVGSSNHLTVTQSLPNEELWLNGGSQP